ncbi:MAG: low molecular weight protein arginine phosphatase [Prosthecobacter sp.]|nr:low molecular weight protein arginine phosphatase [Prosthecobacter sp.]
MKSVLFVCTGNTCRSPLAEVLFRDLVKDRTDYEVLSAGLGALPGAPASRHSADLAKHRGLDLSEHSSRPLTADLVARATHIFAMSSSHLFGIEDDYPEAADKAYLVTEFSADDSLRGSDLSDPFGMHRKAYEEVAEKLDKVLPCVLAYIEQTWKPTTTTAQPE